MQQFDEKILTSKQPTLYPILTSSASEKNQHLEIAVLENSGTEKNLEGDQSKTEF